MKFKKAIIIFFIIIFLIILIYVSYCILKDLFSYKENEELNKELREDVIQVDEGTNESSIDWNLLQSINEDIIGWIEIEDTKINYPILKDSSKLFYLKHSYDKEYNSNGSIFTTNINPFIDDETIIYGHNMQNSSMFSTLDNYLNKDFFYSHLSIKIYTPTQNYQGAIFSAYSIGIEDETNNIKNLDFEKKIEYYKSVSKYNVDYVENIDKIIKLSTCSYINAKTRPTDQRYYIVASITPIE